MSGPNPNFQRTDKPACDGGTPSTASASPTQWLTAGNTASPPPQQFAEAYCDRVPEAWDACDEDPERWDGMS